MKKEIKFEWQKNIPSPLGEKMERSSLFDAFI